MIKVEIKIKNLDYNEIMNLFDNKEKNNDKKRNKFNRNKKVVKIINRFPHKLKDALATQYISFTKEHYITEINNYLSENNLAVEINDINIENM